MQRMLAYSIKARIGSVPSKDKGGAGTGPKPWAARSVNCIGISLDQQLR